MIAALTTAAAAAGGAPPAEPAPAARRASAPAIADYVRARLAAGRGEVTAPAEALRSAVSHDPASPQLRTSLAEALARAGRLAEAEGEARRALERTAGGAAEADARLVLGKILAAAGRPGPAVEELQRAARLEGERARAIADRDGNDLDPEPWRALARVRLETGDAAGATAACEDLAKLDPPSAAAVLRELGARLVEAKDPAAAEERLRRAVELVPSDGDGWKLLARVEEERGLLAAAREAWQRALVADPGDPEALLSAGQLALRQGDLAAARVGFRQLLDVAPDEALAKVRVAAAWLDAKHPADALEAAGRGDRAELLYLRGLALLQLKRWGDAAQVLAEVKPAQREVFAYARVSLAQALWRAGKPAEAVRAVRAALEAQPREAALLFALGEAYDRAGERDAALAQMRAVLAVAPDHAEALNYLGYALAERGERLEEAEALLRRALRLEPENAYFLDSLGWVLFKRGELAPAVEALERADALAGPEPTILEHLGDAYQAARRPADAAGAYRRALAAPEAPEEEPGVAPGTRRASLQRKLEELGAREPRAATSQR